MLAVPNVSTAPAGAAGSWTLQLATLRPPDADEYELQPPLSVVEVDTCVEAADGVGAGTGVEAAVYTASAQAPPEGMPVLAQAAYVPVVEHPLLWPALW